MTLRLTFDPLNRDIKRSVLDGLRSLRDCAVDLDDFPLAAVYRRLSDLVKLMPVAGAEPDPQISGNCPHCGGIVYGLECEPVDCCPWCGWCEHADVCGNRCTCCGRMVSLAEEKRED